MRFAGHILSAFLGAVLALLLVAAPAVAVPPASTSSAVSASGIRALLTASALRLGATGGTIGFLGSAGQALPTAYTQTYSTAARTVPAATLATLTDSSGGTAADTIAAITTGGAAADQGPTRNAIATLAREQARAAADILALKKVITAMIDDLQGYGLAQ